MLINYHYQENRVELPDNCKIAYIDEGKGERTILFIHGLANYAQCWKRNIDFLKHHYRCIAIDLPGNGLSDHNHHSFGMKFFANCIGNFISALKLKKVYLAGHSMGGQVALTTALQFPQLIEKMVLCAPAGFEKFTAMDKAIYYSSISFIDKITTDEQSLRKVLEHSFFHHTAGEHKMVDELISLQKTYPTGYYRKMVEACIKGMIEEPVLDKLQQIATPTMIFFGENDGLIPNKILHRGTTKAVAEFGKQQMPNASMKMIPGCGHFVQWEKAHLINEGIHEFLPTA